MKQKASYRGTGICVSQQYFEKPLVKGDLYFDADLGYVVWDGTKWCQQLSFKHEGSNTYSIRTLPNGDLPEPGKLYKYGELVTQFVNRKTALEFAISKGMIANFEA